MNYKMKVILSIPNAPKGLPTEKCFRKRKYRVIPSDIKLAHAYALKLTKKGKQNE